MGQNIANYNVNSFQPTEVDAKLFIAQQLIEIAKYNLRLWDICDNKQNIPAGHGRTVRWIYYPHLNTPKTTLTQGTDPVGQSFGSTKVEAIADQHGDIVAFTDLEELGVFHPIMAIAQDRMAIQAQRLIDREIFESIKGTTITYFGNGKTSRPNLTTSDKMVTADVQKMVAKLRMNGAQPHDGRNFVAVIDPAVEQDLISYGTNFILAQSYANNTMPLFNGEIGMWAGVRWVSTNAFPVITNNTTVNPGSVSKASSATAGSLTASTTYYFVVVARRVTDGHEAVVYAEASQDTAGGQTSIDLTMPSDVNYDYDVYFSDVSGSTRLSSVRNLAAAVVNVKVVPTTSALVPPIPATNVYVHTSMFFGKGAFGAGTLQNLQFFLTPNTSTPGNVLLLNRYAGWKLSFKSAVLNSNFYGKIESHSDNN
jgi:N4-gp56 family major capsid protein